LKIPFVTRFFESREAANALASKRVEVQEKQLEVRQELAKLQAETQLKALENLQAMASITNGSLSKELYGNTGGYMSGEWNVSFAALRRQARIAYWESDFARAVIGRMVQMVVGKGLALDYQPAWDMLPRSYSDEERQQIIRRVQTRWGVWGKSKKVHHLQESNLHQIVKRAYFSKLYDGEVFVLFRYTGSRGRNPLTIELIAPENIQRVDSNVSPGNSEEEGIEYDKRGVAVAYHVYNPDTGKSVRIAKFGSRSKRQFVYHDYRKLHEKQRRGIPLLTGNIRKITMLADIEQLEMKASAINALLAVVVTPPENEDGQAPISTGVAKKKSLNVTDPVSGETYVSNLEQAAMPEGGVIVENLPAGHDLKSFDTARPNLNTVEFLRAMKRDLCSGIGLALSVVIYDYANQYSSARGENILQWMLVEAEREHGPADLMGVIMCMWLWGEVDGEKIPLDGYGQDEESREAWCRASYRGAPLPDLDPEKSIKAHAKEIEEQIKTRQAVSTERGGGNVADNSAQLKNENDAAAVALKELMRVIKTTYSFSESETTSESTSKTIEGE
jgi:lambda family phage portal protein